MEKNQFKYLNDQFIVSTNTLIIVIETTSDNNYDFQYKHVKHIDDFYYVEDDMVLDNYKEEYKLHILVCKSISDWDNDNKISRLYMNDIRKIDAFFKEDISEGKE